MILKINMTNAALAAVVLFVNAQPALAANVQTFMGIHFVEIPAGCFQMGQDKEVKGSTEAELPSHQVCIEKPFYLAETEVTQKQWEDVMGNNPSKSKSLYKPVEKVSYDDVQAFIQKLNSKEGKNLFRLPTEAEWEYAARAGTTTAYSYGNDPSDLGHYAWFGNEGYGGSSHEVAQRKPNPWGLYDMHGNVWEWVQDWYDGTYYKSSPNKDPKGPDSGQFRVYRGGSWVAKAVNLRSAARYSGLPGSRTRDLGFRLLRQM